MAIVNLPPPPNGSPPPEKYGFIKGLLTIGSLNKALLNPYSLGG